MLIVVTVTHVPRYIAPLMFASWPEILSFLHRMMLFYNFLTFSYIIKIWHSNGSVWIREIISTNTFAFTLLISNISSFVRSIIQSLHKRWNSACEPLNSWTCAASQVAFQPRCSSLFLSQTLSLTPPLCFVPQPSASTLTQSGKSCRLAVWQHAQKAGRLCFAHGWCEAVHSASTSRSWGTRLWQDSVFTCSY